MILFLLFIIYKITMNTDEKYYECNINNLVCFKSNYPSQWYISKFTLFDDEEQKEFVYNCCEQRMMHKKALFFGDYETADKIMATLEPSEQKKLGREVKNFDTDKWNEVADYIVITANYHKFSQNNAIKSLLLATGDKYIVECSPYDKIWGNGLNITDTLKTSMNEWKGTNRLGKALMKVRELLR